MSRCLISKSWPSARLFLGLLLMAARTGEASYVSLIWMHVRSKETYWEKKNYNYWYRSMFGKVCLRHDQFKLAIVTMAMLLISQRIESAHLQPVLGIHRFGSGSADPYLWLTDPNPTLDPSPFFTNFKDAKKIIFFSRVFSHNLPAGTLSSVKKI